jgi:hypothetical protein
VWIIQCLSLLPSTLTECCLVTDFPNISLLRIDKALRRLTSLTHLHLVGRSFQFVLPHLPTFLPCLTLSYSYDPGRMMESEWITSHFTRLQHLHIPSHSMYASDVVKLCSKLPELASLSVREIISELRLPAIPATVRSCSVAVPATDPAPCLSRSLVKLDIHLFNYVSYAHNVTAIWMGFPNLRSFSIASVWVPGTELRRSEPHTHLAAFLDCSATKAVPDLHDRHGTVGDREVSSPAGTHGSSSSVSVSISTPGAESCPASSSTWSALEELSISHETAIKDAPISMDGFLEAPRLQKLSLHLALVRITTLRFLGHLTALRDLIMTVNAEGDLSVLSHLTRLTHLEIGARLAASSRLPRLPQLQTLHLSKGFLGGGHGNRGPEPAHLVECFPNLKHLTLPWYESTASELLCPLIHLRTLRRIDYPGLRDDACDPPSLEQWKCLLERRMASSEDSWSPDRLWIWIPSERGAVGRGPQECLMRLPELVSHLARVSLLGLR